MHMAIKGTDKHRVAIIGGGFGGLNAARALGDAPVEITLIDKRNFHLFQPLLYQVATGNVSPADISAPLRSVLSKNPNTTVLLDEAVGLDPDNQQIELREGTVSYDTLIIATGSSHHYFGNDQWARFAPGPTHMEVTETAAWEDLKLDFVLAGPPGGRGGAPAESVKRLGRHQTQHYIPWPLPDHCGGHGAARCSGLHRLRV